MITVSALGSPSAKGVEVMPVVNRKIKIVFIITGLNTGGAEAMLVKLLQHLDRNRFDPSVISLGKQGEMGKPISALGIPVSALSLRALRPNYRTFFELVKHLRLREPDIVQTWMYHADLFGGLAARLAGCRRVVWGLRNSNLDPNLIKHSTLLVVRICGLLSPWLPKLIISNSFRSTVVHQSQGYRRDKFRVIPNGFDIDRFQPSDDARRSLRVALSLRAETPLVGLIARYDLQKNHAGFIQAAALIHQQVPTVHFVLVGEGVDHNNLALSSAIQKNDLREFVHLLGRRQDMPCVMAALDVLVSSSHGEAFPNVLGEAMSCGVPCVVTDVGDSAAIVGNTGRVVQAGDMTGLARNVVDLLALSSEQKSMMSRKARERVETNFEIGRVAKSYQDLYGQLI